LENIFLNVGFCSLAHSHNCENVFESQDNLDFLLACFLSCALALIMNLRFGLQQIYRYIFHELQWIYMVKVRKYFVNSLLAQYWKKTLSFHIVVVKLNFATWYEQGFIQQSVIKKHHQDVCMLSFCFLVVSWLLMSINIF
jgi:hypothetical protein